MKSRLLKHFIGALVLLLSVASVSADSRTERLNSLFSDLAVEEMPVNAQMLEREIWKVWMDSGDEKINFELSIGVTAMNEGFMDDAINQFSKVTEMAADFAEGWNKRATAYYFNDELEKSLRDIQKTLELEPRHFGAISGMGLIFMKMGNERAALKAFEEVLRLYPTSPSARSQVEGLRRKLNDQMV